MSNDSLGLKILTDEPEKEPSEHSGFMPLSRIIARIIQGSDARFSIGIFGEWGAGKTTLMNLVKDELDKDEAKPIKTIWFDAWRYERENEYALIPLLKTIAYRVEEEAKTDGRYETLRQRILESLKIVSIDMARSMLTRYIMTPSGANELLNYLRKSKSEVAETIMELERDTLYFDGLEKIRDAMRKISNPNDERKYGSKIVVFIDDLDRCSPKKVIEVFESIKIFLDIEGFVYVLGLSREIILKAIEEVYRKYEVNGEEYVRKIIQVPLKIPDWTEEHIESLIDDLLKKGKIGTKYQSVISSNKSLISKIVESNPRELKRFINCFFVAYEKHYENIRNQDQAVQKLLLVQALKLRWEDFYKHFSRDEEFRQKLRGYLDENDVEHVKKELNKRLPVDINHPRFQGLMEFLQDNTNTKTVFGISDWMNYRQIVDSVMSTRASGAINVPHPSG